LKLFTDVLLPGWVKGDEFWEEVSSHLSLNNVGVMELLSIMISLHSATGAFDILSVEH